MGNTTRRDFCIDMTSLLVLEHNVDVLDRANVRTPAVVPEARHIHMDCLVMVAFGKLTQWIDNHVQAMYKTMESASSKISVDAARHANRRGREYRNINLYRRSVP